jgi:aspartyl-tRNA(Asn)/glutamyl-tRNA(Gln) amidotransferase subunit A
VQAWFDRLMWNDHVRRFFERYDLLLTPTIAGPPFKVGLDNPTEIGGKPVEPYDWIPFTYPFNLTGNPCPVPAYTRDGLPIGLQIGRRFDDVTCCAPPPATSGSRPGRQEARAGLSPRRYPS